MPNNKSVLYSCSHCGSKFSPQSTGGVCPYCHVADPALVERQRLYYKKQQIRKKQLKKAAFRLSAALLILIVIIVSAISIVTSIIHGNESLVFKSENLENAPIFFTNSDGKSYFCLKGNSYIIGNGTVTDFAYSEKNKVTYAIFNGSRDSESPASSSQLLKISNSGKKIETISDSPYGNISFITGGNCEYIYYLVSETLSNYQSSARLYLYSSKAKEPKRIAEYEKNGYYSDYRVSANGRYLLYKAEDGDGTKLMKYSVKSGVSEALGIKNAEPVSIDNKGQYYSYIRINEEGLADFYIESDVNNREKTPLDKAVADRILISNDYRSFVIETGNITTVKVLGNDPCIIAARTGSGIGINIIKNMTSTDVSENISSGVHTIEYCVDNSFLPYYYITFDNEKADAVMRCDKSGVKEAVIDTEFTDFCTNGEYAAYISDNSLYTVKINDKNPPFNLISENFEGYDLYRISDNGKYIFFSDGDGNMFRIPFKYNGADWIKTAVDANPYIVSADGRIGVYASGNALYFGKDTKQEKIADEVNLSASYVMSGCEQIYCLSKSDTSKAENAYSLYLFDGKNLSAIADNVTSAVTYPNFSLSYNDIPYSTYIPPLSSPQDSTETENTQNTNADNELE